MKHTLKGIAEDRYVLLDGKLLSPLPSQLLHNHSPDGFNWGYGGSGPSQLALAVLLELTGGPGNYQEFKWRVIANLPSGKDFEIEFELHDNEIA